MKQKIFLGFDTSNYTTSLAAASEDGKILVSEKRLLPVKEGSCGLRQSDALFHHTVALPQMIAELKREIGEFTPLAVGVSEKPRNQEGSYMPCFLAGVSAATAAAFSADVPLYGFTHQCGHLMAAIHSSGRYDLLEKPFAAFHVSGGTTEFLCAEKTDGAFNAEIVGGTRDLNAGQIVDRVGVMLGLSFPAGPALEALAKANEKPLPPCRISSSGCYVNLSGLQNLAEKLYKDSGDKALTAAFTLQFLAESLSAIAASYEKENGKTPFLFAGGVMSNTLIRGYLEKRFDAAFAAPEFSRDNAAGIALLTRESYFAKQS